MVETAANQARRTAVRPDHARLIRHAHIAWQNAERERDLRTILSLVTDDIVLLRPRAAQLQGRQAIEDFYRTLWMHYHMVRSTTIRELRLMGDWGWLWTFEDARLIPHSGGRELVLAGDAFAVLRRSCDGDWRWARIASSVIPVRKT
jgi:ketosteroid isomerase-like protein